MLSKKLTGTFPLIAAGVIAASSYIPQVRADLPIISTNYLSTAGVNAKIGPETSTNAITKQVVTNNVFRVIYTNAQPGQSYTIQQRNNLVDGENAGHYWINDSVRAANSNGVLTFGKTFNPNVNQFFRVQYFTTNYNEGVQNDN